MKSKNYSYLHDYFAEAPVTIIIITQSEEQTLKSESMNRNLCVFISSVHDTYLYIAIPVKLYTPVPVKLYMCSYTWHLSVGTKKSRLVPPGRDMMEKTPDNFNYFSKKSFRLWPYFTTFYTIFLIITSLCKVSVWLCHLLAKRYSSYSWTASSDLGSTCPMT